MTVQEQLQEEVRNIALDLEAVACGHYNFSTGDIVDSDDGFARYFENVYDIEYRVDSQLRYKGAIITVAVGGPSIYIDTHKGEVVGRWWSDKATVDIWRTTANALDDFFEEEFNCLRDCY